MAALWLAGYGGTEETAHRADVKAIFATSATSRGRLTHMVGAAFVVWRFGAPSRLAVEARCGAWLTKAKPVAEAPEGRDYCDWCLLADSIPATVYRLLGAGDLPLYIGCTTNLVWRLRGHMTSSHFWPLVLRWTTEEFDSIEAALLAERAAILAEQPPFNIDMTDRAKQRARRPAAQPCIRRPKVSVAA